MTDTSPSPFRRFPWAQLVFCVACLTMTAWTWMRYSYRWDFPFRRYSSDTDKLRMGRWPDGLLVRDSDVFGQGAGRVELVPQYEFGLGREYYELQLNTNTSRFHSASIAGIVVGLMGCFVFGLYLRRWVKERRAGPSAPAQ